MALSLIKVKMVNNNYVKCNMFKRGNNLFSYYGKNREIYIYVYVKIFTYILIFT